MHTWPWSLISCLSIEIWLQKSSCWLRSHAMQQPVLSNWQTGLHFACKPHILNPRSSRTAWRPFGLPLDVVIFWRHPRLEQSRFDCGIMESRCLRCLPPLPLFMSNACNASGGKVAWADELSKMNNAWHSRPLTFSWIWIADFTWSRRCSCVHQASPLAPG